MRAETYVAIAKLTALSCSRYHEQLGKSAFSMHFEKSFA
jgi:hypothetical protein